MRRNGSPMKVVALGMAVMPCFTRQPNEAPCEGDMKLCDMTLSQIERSIRNIGNGSGSGDPIFGVAAWR